MIECGDNIEDAGVRAAAEAARIADAAGDAATAALDQARAAAREVFDRIKAARIRVAAKPD